MTKKQKRRQIQDQKNHELLRSGIPPRRFMQPSFENPILEGDPLWDEAPFEEVFLWRDGGIIGEQS